MFSSILLNNEETERKLSSSKLIVTQLNLEFKNNKF